jgi:hypothetical protein
MAETLEDVRRLEGEARRAYERGRARIGLTQAALVAPVAALAFLQCTSAAPIALAVTLLTGVVGLAAWRGQDYGRGGRAGLAAGLSPFALPLVANATGVLCSATVCAILPATCVAGGLLGGLVLGTRSRGPRQPSVRFWLSAVAVTLAAGAVGCLGAGLLGLLGMGAGLATGTAPVLVLRRLRASA